ncbi:hypothetical protein ZWY2020_015506 [Hordeum vulgare]|nr:hypothetical protein ZWY2020_015506 [Hordeum vulgare]
MVERPCLRRPCDYVGQEQRPGAWLKPRGLMWRFDYSKPLKWRKGGHAKLKAQQDRSRVHTPQHRHTDPRRVLANPSEISSSPPAAFAVLRLRQRIVSHILSSSSTSTSAISLSTGSSPHPQPRFPKSVASPWRSTSSTSAASPGPRRSRPPEALPPQVPANPDAVLAFLSGLSLSSDDAAAVVAKDPLFLCAGVENPGPRRRQAHEPRSV